jgi:hypothetical protein
MEPKGTRGGRGAVHPRSAAGVLTMFSGPETLRDLLCKKGLADSAFLKRATIRMLASHCDNTDEGFRLFDWLHERIEERRALAAA